MTKTTTSRNQYKKGWLTLNSIGTSFVYVCAILNYTPESIGLGCWLSSLSRAKTTMMTPPVICKKANMLPQQIDGQQHRDQGVQVAHDGHLLAF